MTLPEKTFSLGDLAAWVAEGDAARPVPAEERRHVFSTVTMSGLPNGSPPMLPGGLFVAVKGVRDGHDFARQAFENGARAALVTRVPANLEAGVADGSVAVWRSGAPEPAGQQPILFFVDEPMRALQRLGAWWRRNHDARVLALTGSVGKTTTKDLLTAILARRGTVLSTRGNFNNELGLPFMLLELTPAHRYAVLEIGISAVGEMETFAGIAQPDVGIVTRVAPAHLEQFGDVDTVEREKGRLVESLTAEGIAVLNADDPRVRRMAQRTPARSVTYGLAADADVRAEAVQLQGFEGVRFRLVRGTEAREVTVPLIGAHFVTTALAAATAAFEEGTSWEDVIAGLSAPLPGRRLDVLSLPTGVTLLDDTYNASPAAMTAALDVLATCRGRRIAVLGDMFEMGEAGPAAHGDVGAYVPGHADLLVAVGELGQFIAAAALDAGLPQEQVQWCATPAEATELLAARLTAGDYVLIKGSRGMHMEQIVAGLAGDHLPAGHGAH